ncbi:MAG TPA: pyridoxal phosphate-dependent aminotransferase [Acidobacteriaceae bacterium]|nr:pyridoxal phosphate-dependent aminotransferase [Acidobacteriaceae bacterium]
MSRFSARTSWDTSESRFAAVVRVARASAERDGRRLYDLTISNPTKCGFDYDAEALLAPLKDPRALIYDPEPRGLLTAREAVARYYAGHGAQVSAEDLVLTTSTSEAYSFLFRLLCNARDEVLVPQPSYPLFDFLAELDDVQLKSYPLFYDHGWWIDRARLEAAIDEQTRAIMVVHPNNPTGHWTRSEERAWLEELCARRGLPLIVDEVFLDYPLSERSVGRSFATDEHPALTFVLSGLSKIAGLPQMKAAWIAVQGPEEGKHEVLARLEVIADTFLSMNAPVQLALPSWLERAGEIQTQIRERAQRNYTFAHRIATENPERLHVLEADAGWSAVVTLRGWHGDGDLAEWLVRERGVIVHPGSFYGMPQKNRIVASLIGPAAEFTASIQRAISL